MAFNKDQNEPVLPANGSSKRQSQNHLPRYYRTPANTKFLNSTLDQLIQPGVVEKINSYYGRQTAKAFTVNDNYVGDVLKERDDYQLEPALVIKDDLDNVIFYKDYNDYINQLSYFNKGELDHSVINSQEYYAWNPHIDWDKFTNFREYYWLPNGPQSIPLRGNTVDVESTIKVTVLENDDNNSYLFSTFGSEPNPTITLYRGQTYKFEIDAPNLPFTIKTKRTLDEQFNIDSSSIIVQSGIDIQGVETGTTTIKFSADVPDIIYYVAGNDIEAAGTILIKDIEEATFIDVEKEILNKKYYKTSNGIDLSNGMKVYFTGEVVPETYASNSYYVEGVGTSIKLIPETSLNVPTEFADDVFVEFDTEGFDRLPYSKAIGYPTEKDYLVINRSSTDGNLWSRYNRWFHKSVIEKSAAANDQPIEVDQAQRAKRPIIEFESGLKLSNFGTYAKQDVDLIDTYTKDVFSTIEGKQGYNIDGTDVVDGMRILFTADTDILVTGRIFEVEFINFSSGSETNRQIHLKEVDDTQPVENDVVLVSNGATYKGKIFYYDGTEWKAAQSKTERNQAPRFDVFDSEGYSYGDLTQYPANNFLGTKLFSYQDGTGSTDSELGFPIEYRNIENVGDILFNFDLLSDNVTYTIDNQIYIKNTDIGYVRKYSDQTTYSTQNGWVKAPTKSEQPVLRQYVFDNTTSEFVIDVYDDSASLEDIWIRVYLNNVLMFEGVDYNIGETVEGNLYVKFVNDLTLDDIILIKTKSSAIKNNNGFYEIPTNLERNPLNDNLVDFTLGEVNDHVATIIEQLDTFSGLYPGTSNLRDLGTVSQYGTRFVQHSSPLNLGMYHVLDKDSNMIKSLRFARSEYAKFKRLFLSTAKDLGYNGLTKDHVDEILKEINKDKTPSMPFYFSDMLPLGATRKNTYVIEDIDQTFFALETTFLLSTQSRRAVTVYQNNQQLVHGKDYTFNEDGFCVITADKLLDDVIEIYEYETTNASFIPPTPTKLGLYPKYVPELLIDDTYQPYIDSHVGNGTKTTFAIKNIHTIIPNELVKVKVAGVEQFGNYAIEEQEEEKVVVFDNPVETGDAVDIEYPHVVIQGHDGSIIHSFNDYRDELILEFENRVFNNLKIEYDVDLFDIHKFVGGEYRDTGLSRNEINKPMLKDFIEFSNFIETDYTLHNFFERTNRFTFNYSESQSYNGSSLPGFWRQIYKEAYDTDRPHTHPWEMLGFTIKPTWWEEVYGPAPYTKENLILWDDLEKGIVREPNKRIVIKNAYKRPELTSHIPVDQFGYLLAPLDSSYVGNFTTQAIDDSFVFGDGAPVETAWRKSSEYPFALLTSLLINKPSDVLSTAFDRVRQVRNAAGQLVYNDTQLRLRLKDIVFPNTQNDTTQIYTAGLINYVANYMTNDVLKSYSSYKENLVKVKNQIGFKIGGFTDKDKFKLILDSRTPLNEGNVFVPDENYSIILNTSSPIETITYSGVIVEKREDGFVIKGYDNDSATFKYYQTIASQSDANVNIGGISEAYLVWDTNKNYVSGTNVEYQGNYYRVKETHISSSSFDSTKFAKLPYLPLVGGRNAFIRKNFVKTIINELSYGTILPTVQDVVDFLLGYGEWLTDKGFIFDYFEGQESLVIDWRHAVNEFMFWTTQNWNSGAVITLSPAATQLKFRTEYAKVDDIYDSFYSYSLLKSDGQKLDAEFSSLIRQPNEFSIKPKNTADGIFSVKLPLVQTEHVCLIDNKTVFGDTIFDLQPGYRQERIKVLGYRTAEWDGSLNIPGFIYDDVSITEWEAWKDYAIGDVVRYKEFYYSAATKIPGEETFTATKWSRLEEKPEPGLYANFEYKTNQIADFYDLDSDNFDTEQQRLAQHLIGYQKRTYLENIVNDSVSQYKFYQGMIADKGSQNALTKLFDALASNDKDSLEFYEEWALKDGQYGAAEGFDEVEFKLDESKFRVSPQPIELVKSLTGNETDLTYRILPYETYVKNENYDHAPFPSKNVLETYVKNAGYVNQEDILGITNQYEDITLFFYNQVPADSYIWVGNYKRSWSVFKHTDTDYSVEAIKSGSGNFTIILNTTPKDISVGDVIGISNIYRYNAAGSADSSKNVTYDQVDLEGFYIVESIANNELTLTSGDEVEDIDGVNGTVTKFIEVRAPSVSAANNILQKGVELDNLIWIDDDNNGNWSVLKNTQGYNELQRLYNAATGTDHNYGVSLSADERNTTLLVGAPDYQDGRVYVYNRPANSVNFIQSQIIEPFQFGEDNERFGASVAVSPDGRYAIIGSPNASNVKTKYYGNFVSTSDYGKGSIVLKDQSLWRAVVDIDGQLDAIEFNSFGSATKVAEDLNIFADTTLQGPGLLVGNYAIDSLTDSYAFPNTEVHHILVRAPKEMYEGSGEGDEVRLSWNLRTYSNQDQLVLADREPFNGSYDIITREYLEALDRTIQFKVDGIFYINSATNIPSSGDVLETTTGSGTVCYVHSDAAETVIYLKDVNGSFNNEDSLFRSDGDFIGEYVKQAPVDSVDSSDAWGGYWFIQTSGYTPTLATEVADEGKALVIYDVIPDSTATGRYYHSSLRYRANTTNSQNTISNYVRVLSFTGAPGPGNISGDTLSSLFVARAPKAVTDVVTAGDTIDLYINQIPNNDGLIVRDLENINLSKAATNKSHTIHDVWDGYINFEFTKFDAGGNPFEPKVGLTVRDRTLGGTAEVAYYQRNGLEVTVFVKNVTGTWSVGDDYGGNAEIEFLGVPSDPDTTYQVDRIMGQIQFTGLGYPSAGIGGLLVFDVGTTIDVPALDTLIDIECWFYNSGTVSGIPRPANPPSPVNNEWTQVYQIPADNSGDAPLVDTTNEGMYAIYQRSRPGVYSRLDSYIVPERASNAYLGTDIQITRFDDLYRAFIHAKGTETEGSPGRIYMLKNGTENNLKYSWDYAKNKKFKGAFNESLNYYTGDIVYVDDLTGTLYTAKTNIAAGTFDSTDWTSTDDVVDYVGFIPNNTGLSVFNDSTVMPTVLDQTNMYSFGSAYDVSKNGDVLVTNALYNGEPNRVVVYRSNNGHFERRQEILASDDTTGFGQSVSISDDGTMIAISAPYNDDVQQDQGVVYVYKQVNGTFVLYQTLNSPNNERSEMFGWKVQFDGTTLAVSARNADARQETTIDVYSERLTGYVNDPESRKNISRTTFDQGLTEIATINENSGVVYLYEDYNSVLIYAQTVSLANSNVDYFGRNILVKNNHVYVGLPRLDSDGVSTIGEVVDYRRGENSKVWEEHRKEKQTVDLERIKKVFLYNTKSKEVITYLDYIDPLQGKVAGIAEQELSFKTYYDPASYTAVATGISAVQDSTNAWGPEHVGRVWWDLSTCKFINPYQDSVIFSTQNWNRLSQGSVVDIYEWVESDVTPSKWDSLADTNEGFPKGYSGTSLYGDSVYSTRSIYDSVSSTFKTKYYFWVKNKKITPDVEFRSININDIANYIADPQGAGIKYAALISPTQFVLYNCEDLVEGTDVALSVQFWNIDNKTQNIHNQYQIISDGLETSLPNNDVLRKWFDSLIGYDEQNRQVPDPSLSPKYKYGTLFKPRQSWFVNRAEALKQFIERVNSVLNLNLIVDDKNISTLFTNEEPPTAESREYDVVVDTLADLDFIGVAKAEQANLTPIVEDGKITRIVINNTGRGYKVSPTVKIYGNGSDAEISLEINNLGQIVSATVVDSGSNYDSSTTIEVRKFAALVNNDTTIQGKWAIYERVQESGGFWNRIKSQAFDVSLFWDYIDWYATGYSDLTNIDYLINDSYELTSLNNDIGDVVKIANVGTGGWLLLEKIDEQENVDYTVNYKTIGRENGTIEFSEKLYNTQASNVGFDTISFDSKIYDNEPVEELRIILDAIKDELLVDDLLYEFNQLFFASLRYVFSEQLNVDWAFKTSFIKAKHNVGELRKDITFNNDNLPSYEAYVKEVKPFKTKIREYLSAYESLEPTNSSVTDFDLAPAYKKSQNRILPETITVNNNTLIGVDADLEVYPNKHWLDNSSYKVISVEINDPGEGYLSPPQLIIEGGGGTGAELIAYLGRNGAISSVGVLKQGSGYYSAPNVTINGNLKDGGRAASFSVVIGDSPVRGIHTVVRFDRITGTYLHTELTKTESFNGTGSKFEFDLIWPMDLNTNNIEVVVNGIEALSSEYTYENIKDTTKGYTRYAGRISFVEAPANNVSVVVSYKKSVELLTAQDRINNYYDPANGQIGKDLGQLMDGIDYGGVEVKSFGFRGEGGWDDDNFGNGTWDTTYDTTFTDEIFTVDDDSTTLYTFETPLETGVTYNVYKNGVRIDDPNYGTGDEVTNPNATMQSIAGAEQTGWSRTDDGDTGNIVTFDEEVYSFASGDQIIFRKTTSDGTFDTNPDGYDTIITGGNLNYSTATGLAAEDITIDGDGFVTPTTSKGPEELVPGQIVDTVDIKVYERPKGGSSPVTTRVYKGDGSTKVFDMGSDPILADSIFVKVGFNIQSSENYTVDYAAGTLALDTAPAENEKVNIITMGVSGTHLLDMDEFIADGSTGEFLTSIRWSDNLEYYITVDGVRTNNVVFESDETYAVPNNIVIKFPTPPKDGTRIRYAFFDKDAFDDPKPYSEVLIETFTADGSTTSFELTQTPFTTEPAQWYTIVKVNNKILNAGYNKEFVCTETRLEYSLDEWQFPPGTLRSEQVKVFLNDQELKFLDEWSFIGTPTRTDQDGTSVRLKPGLGQQDGDILSVYVIDNGEYGFGIMSADYAYTETPGILQLDSPYSEGDTITVYQFSNHDSQGMERFKYDVVDRLNITSNTGIDSTIDDLKEDWYTIMHLRNGLIELRKEALDAQYVWVSLNGDLLTPNVDYYVTDNKRYVKVTADVNENDVLEVIQFSNVITTQKYGWRQFKDMLNRTHYKRLDGTEDIKLASDLTWYDDVIILENHENLPSPLPNAKLPSVIFIEGERIEYFIKDGNTLKQLRRGTLGTSIKNVHLAGTEVYNQSVTSTVPYNDKTLTTIFTADGTSAQYELDFIPNSVNDFEVFVAGRRLRKNAIDVYVQPNPTYQDSPEGDETAPAEFSIEGNILTLTDTPDINQKVIIIRKQGTLWATPGTALADTDNEISRFLRAKSVDLPR
jgi:hypothetical protein